MDPSRKRPILLQEDTLLRGDILGNLYQSYFDPETRLALGEFYTPPEVVDFILDAVGYAGPQVIVSRLLDPACGSGTFLVHALL
jgi:type I restriction-modification system DNA methylase subunit